MTTCRHRRRYRERGRSLDRSQRGRDLLGLQRFQPLHDRIGEPGYGSDIQGATGSVGDAYFNGFAGRTNAGSFFEPGGRLYGGGNLRLSGSVNNGGVNVAGTVTMNGASIYGGVTGGGNLGGSGGTVYGDGTSPARKPPAIR